MPIPERVQYGFPVWFAAYSAGYDFKTADSLRRLADDKLRKAAHVLIQGQLEETIKKEFGVVIACSTRNGNQVLVQFSCNGVTLYTFLDATDA